MKINLPNNVSKEILSNSLNGSELAKQISHSLAKKAVAMRVNNQMIDLSVNLNDGDYVEIITIDDPEGLEIIRHTTAHLLGQSLKLLYPTVKMAIGPVIENGFYYDIDLENSLKPEDLEKIERKMQELVKRNYSVIMKKTNINKALEIFSQRGEDYKLEIIQQDIKNQDQINLYYHEEYIDMCRGPHLPRIGFLKAFKLTHLAGAYWRGNSNSKMLQRIYGVSFRNNQELEDYLKVMQEAEKRDHRKIAKFMKLYHIQEEAPGIPFWQPNGTIILNSLKEFIRLNIKKHSYQEIQTPTILSRSLWERSGHWAKFKEDMFTINNEQREYAIKPMNCPGAIQIFNQGLKSYRDLPVKYSEFGYVHRNEASGTLHGLLRLKGFTQDDAHVFCEEDELEKEVQDLIKLLYTIYNFCGFYKIIVKLSTRPEKRVGSDQIWDKSEMVLKKVLDDLNLDWEELEGEGAFYGPKVEFALKDVIGRVWQCGTIQVDFSMPERLGASYIGKDGNKHVPVMIHRAILGSFERFIGIMLEHYNGYLPLWLMPIQVCIITITSELEDYARQVYCKLVEANVRVELDLRVEKINYKIRENILKKVQLFLIIGEKERDSSTVSVRNYQGKTEHKVKVDEFIKGLSNKIKIPV